MMADLRHLLAIYVHAHQTGNSVPPHIDAEARAALADKPAVPKGREPTRDELWELWLRLDNEMPDKPAAVAELWEHARVHTRALCGTPTPAPPADGEVAELVADLQQQANHGYSEFISRDDLLRAAELLQRQALVPVAVAERPWEREGWCDELGRCWWGRGESDDWSADWTLATPEAVAEFCEFSPRTVCLPAHALPVPEASE